MYIAALYLVVHSYIPVFILILCTRVCVMDKKKKVLQPGVYIANEGGVSI